MLPFVNGSSDHHLAETTQIPNQKGDVDYIKGPFDLNHMPTPHCMTWHVESIANCPLTCLTGKTALWSTGTYSWDGYLPSNLWKGCLKELFRSPFDTSPGARSRRYFEDEDASKEVRLESSYTWSSPTSSQPPELLNSHTSPRNKSNERWLGGLWLGIITRCIKL